jgi:hypothetical protein
LGWIKLRRTVRHHIALQVKVAANLQRAVED